MEVMWTLQVGRNLQTGVVAKIFPREDDVLILNVGIRTKGVRGSKLTRQHPEFIADT
jgi:hypothetical protein